MPVNVPASTTVAFSALAAGDGFIYSGAFFMKTSDATQNYVNLATGNLGTLAGGTQVQPGGFSVQFDI